MVDTVDVPLVTEPTEFISYECEINNEFDEYLKGNDFHKCGFNYNVVTILGCQSSGKSYLLNSLFGMNFQVMNTKLGHSQTTKGLWASIVKPSGGGNTTLVIDVEGTDSRERGENRLTFEHRSSLFSLSLSDCVIINLWYHTLGNLTGSNYGLLRTVVEANLELMASSGDVAQSKTILLFCVRDWFPDLAPIEIIEQNIKKSYMQAIWNDISKPDKFSSKSVEDLFKIEVYGIRHAILDNASFQIDVASIKKRWEAIRQTKYCKGIPSDGFYIYSKNIWETIKAQNHLDIPSQKEMLGNFRCREIANQVLHQREPEIAAKVQEAQAEVVRNFNTWATKFVNGLMDDYMVQASRYELNSCIKSAHDLLEMCFRNMQQVFDLSSVQFTKQLLLKVSSRIEDNFCIRRDKKVLIGNGKKPIDVWSTFDKTMAGITKEAIKELEDFVKGYNFAFTYQRKKFVPDQIEVKHEFQDPSIFANFSAAVEKELSLTRLRHLELLKEMVKELAEAKFKEVEQLLLDREIDANRFWSQITDCVQKVKTDCMDIYSAGYVNLTGNSREEFELLCSILIVKSVRLRLEDICESIGDIIISRFETFFHFMNYKGEDIPRDWTCETEETILKIYVEAKRSSLLILDVLKECQKIDIPAPAIDKGTIKKDHLLYNDFSNNLADILDVKESISLLDMEVVVICERRFQEMYKTALTQLNSLGQNWKNIPPLFWLMMVVLGWNEMLALCRVIFKVQIILPLLVILVVFFNYFEKHSPRAKRLIGPLKKTAIHVFTTTTIWTIGKIRERISSQPSDKVRRKVPEDDSSDYDTTSVVNSRTSSIKSARAK